MAYVRLQGRGLVYEVDDDMIKEAYGGRRYEIRGNYINELGRGTAYEISGSYVRSLSSGRWVEVSGGSISVPGYGLMATYDAYRIRTIDGRFDYSIDERLTSTQMKALIGVIFA